jgi:hypothetical protein
MLYAIAGALIGFLIGVKVKDNRWQFTCLQERDRGNYWHVRYCELVRDMEEHDAAMEWWENMTSGDDD